MPRSRLLVLDDEPEVCNFVKDVAETSGYEVAVAHRFDDFVKTWKTWGPCLIILDLNIPGTDGIEVLRHLSAEKCDADLVIVSGTHARIIDSAARLARSHNLRLAGTLQKPLELDALEEVFDKALRRDPRVSEQELRAAMTDGRLVLHYQPKVNLKAEPIAFVTSAEALVRYEHPRRGLIGSGSLISIAEQANLMDQLTKAVLEMAVRQIRAWEDAGLRVSVAINVAPSLLLDLGFPDWVADRLGQFDIPASRVTLEMTESGAIASTKRGLETLTRLRLKGVSLSLDDFGIGHSSLLRLHRMPFSEVKIDRSFVTEMTTSESARLIVRSIVDLAHGLGVTTCAEGVESSEIAASLRALDCDWAQGCFFGPPLPAAEVADLIRGHRGMSRQVQAYASRSEWRPERLLSAQHLLAV